MFASIIINCGFHFSYASKVGAIHFQTSAKQNLGIEELFLTLTERMLERVAEQVQNEVLQRRNSQRRNVVVVEDDQVPNLSSSSRHCCGNS